MLNGTTMEVECGNCTKSPSVNTEHYISDKTFQTRGSITFQGSIVL